jgi:hypothetical protein
VCRNAHGVVIAGREPGSQARHHVRSRLEVQAHDLREQIGGGFALQGADGLERTAVEQRALG